MHRAHWQLLDNPNRLNIQTIDALCASIVRKMPVLTQFGMSPAILSTPYACYLDAAAQLLASIEEETPWRAALLCLLQRLDNNHERVQQLIASMLGMREQWMHEVLGQHDRDALRAQLEENLAAVVRAKLVALSDVWPHEHSVTLVKLARFAASILEQSAPVHPLVEAITLEQMPGATLDDYPLWQALLSLLLTEKGTLRRTVTKNIGFPAPTSTQDKSQKALFKSMKQQMVTLLAALQDNDALMQALYAVKVAPALMYEDEQWTLLDALLTVLPVALAQLKLVFTTEGAVDFNEISLAALVALGHSDAPTDLALSLDYRIEHILVDEFQDTAWTQYQLLERLTAGWQYDDGRTLFVVGDPMQSIYRFRQAEVGLFLNAKEQGIGQVRLRPLTLSTNFRSCDTVVQWVNQTFTQVFPANENVAMGAVSYSMATAVKSDKTASVVFHPLLADATQLQADTIVTLVQDALAQDDSSSIAILVRARTHLLAVLPALKQANIPYQAVEIEQLQHRSIVHDLMVLTRALLYWGDRIAWLALLRAPWCGLTLNALHTLVADDANATVWECIQQSQKQDLLAPEECTRLMRLVHVIKHCFDKRARQPIALWVEGAWLALGGPACLSSEDALVDARAYFQLLAKLDAAGEALTAQNLELHVARLFAANTGTDNARVQVMTMHKSKGLEFDVVIIPELARTGMHDSAKLLAWMRAPDEVGQLRLLFAPLYVQRSDEDPIYAYIRRQEKQKATYELGRLLYVAITRARRNLHLIGALKHNEKGEREKPPSGSLLAMLWDDLASISAPLITHNEHVVTEQSRHGIYLKRLPSTWQLPASMQKVLSDKEKATNNPTSPAAYVWEAHSARFIGTLVHRQLQRIVLGGLDAWPVSRLKTCHTLWESELAEHGVPTDEIPQSVATVDRAVRQMLADERGRWILSEHQNSECELHLMGIVNNRLKKGC